MLTLVLAATVGWSAPDARFVAVLAVHVQRADVVAPESRPAPEPTVATVPYYYARISRVLTPGDPLLPKYDSRLRQFRTRPW